MQVPALFQPMNLGRGFGFFGEDDLAFSSNDNFNEFGFAIPSNNIFEQGYSVVPEYDPVTGEYDPNFIDITGAARSITIAVVEPTSGNVNDQFGKPIISNDQITNIALNNPGQEAEAVAKTLQITSPDWAKQFKSTDDLVKAAYNLFNTSKAVIQGKPIPPSIQSPYVYNPNDPNMIRRTTTTTATQTGLSTTNMLLIGGVALAAFLVLRKK